MRSSSSSNDKKVRDLVLKVPGNLECADCGDGGKAVIKFCSVKLGVFLCNQCYAAHRALGAHITRGKCIGLDSFTDQEVALLTNCGGNRCINAHYEATMPATAAKPPPTPCNGCSLSTCRDCKQRLQFITRKYEQKLWYSNTPVVASSTPVFPSTLQPQQQQSAGTGTINTDPFGLFSSNSSSAPSTASSKPTNPSDTDFFASFGL